MRMEIPKWSRHFSTARCLILPFLNREANKELPQIVDLCKSHFSSAADSSDTLPAVYRGFLPDKMKVGLVTEFRLLFSTFHNVFS